MLRRSLCAILTLRGAAAVLFAFMMAAIIQAQPTPSAVRAQPTKKGDKKEPDKKEPTKPPEIQWPKEINGKDIHAVMKDMEDHDPVIREFAARTLPLFGPPAQKKEVSKLLLRRMTGVEKDPTVRVAIFDTVGKIQFEDENDNKDALRILTQYVDRPVGPSASFYRFNAIQAITLFGPKAKGAITALTGVALNDPSYETRRSIAKALGVVGFDEKSGPNMNALTKLADVLAKDESASVRMEAMQSLMLIGPPWAGVKAAGANAPLPAINVKDAAKIINFLKKRVGDPSAKPPLQALEKDKQVEIWERLVLMRFDPIGEVNDENLNAIAKYLSGDEIGVKAQALSALSILGELGARKVKDVVRVMEDKTMPIQLTVTAINTLGAMGAGAKPAIPDLRKFADDKKKEIEVKKMDLMKKNNDPQLLAEKAALEELVKHTEKIIEFIDKAKPISPAGMNEAPPKKK